MLPEALSASAPAVALPSETDIRARLLQVVVERTGYPADLVDQNASLEADLGIDSIKRVEIIGELWRSVPHGLAEPPPGLMEDLTAAPTLVQIAVRMAAGLAGPGSGSLTAAPSPVSSSSPPHRSLAATGQPSEPPPDPRAPWSAGS